MNFIQSAGVLAYRIHKHQREYLLIRSIKGHWDFPKGKCEKNETLLQTAVRELHEETGLTALLLQEKLTPINWTFIENGNVYYKTGTFFIGLIATENAIHLSSEHNEFKWLPYQEAYKLLSHATSHSLLAEAEELLCSKANRKD